MAELPPNSAPDNAQQPSSAPDGWDLACAGILRSEFGRLPSRALDRAMMQLSAEQAWRESQAAARMNWLARILGLSVRPAVALGVIAVFVVIAAGWLLLSGHQGPTPMVMAIRPFSCRVADAIDPHWARGSAQFKAGDILPGTPLRLESGVVELAFSSGARAAVQGPVEFKVADWNSLELRQGRLSAEVPKQAIGFTVRTPNATVVDLGTRFGIDAQAQGSEVNVFEGKVHVTQQQAAKHADGAWDLTRNMAMILDERGGATTEAAAEATFPQPARAIMVRPVNCGFDAQGATQIGGVPSTFGVWSGPAFELTGMSGNVRPAQGPGMLRFLAPPLQNGRAVDSVVWQLIDLRPAKDFMSAYGRVDLRAWAHFNRVSGGPHTGTKFKLSIAAFHGQPADAPALWAGRKQTALAFAEQEVEPDKTPQAWERVDVVTTVSADADFAVVEIRAIAPQDSLASADPFPGNFADTVEAKVCLPLRAGSSTMAR